MLHWLYPEVFTTKTSQLFRSSFDLSKGQISIKVMDDARRLLELIMLRRMKNSPSVKLDLPPKKEVVLYVPLTPMQRFWYRRLLTRTDKGLLEEVFKGAKDKEAEVIKEEVAEEQATKESLGQTAKNGVVHQKSKNMAHVKDDLSQTNSCGTSAEAEAFEGMAGDNWAESRAIMKRAVEMEHQSLEKVSDWRKLMNLLMQLRKVQWPYLS